MRTPTWIHHLCAGEGGGTDWRHVVRVLIVVLVVDSTHRLGVGVSHRGQTSRTRIGPGNRPHVVMVCYGV